MGKDNPIWKPGETLLIFNRLCISKDTYTLTAIHTHSSAFLLPSCRLKYIWLVKIYKLSRSLHITIKLSEFYLLTSYL